MLTHVTGPTPTICDVLPGVAALLGAAGGDDRLGLVEELGPRRQVVVVLVDGLGLHLLPRLAPHAPFLAHLALQAGSLRTLRSVFPSTTPTNLVSLGTGVTAGEHGVLGFTVNIPGSSRVLTHVAWHDDPSPASWQPVPTWFERLAALGVRSASVLPAAFEHGGLTAAAYRGSSFVPVPAGSRGHTANVSAIVDALDRQVRLVLGYTDVLDAAAHRFGIASAEWLAAAAEVDAFLGALVARLPADTALLVTADHGGFDVPPDRRVDLDGDPVLSDGIEVVAGEPRVRYLHTRAGAADDVVAAWTQTLGTRASVLTRDEAIGAGWFGPVRPEHEARIGDVVVICDGDTVVLASAHEPAAVGALIGFHGSHRPEETAIPLIAFTHDG